MMKKFIACLVFSTLLVLPFATSAGAADLTIPKKKVVKMIKEAPLVCDERPGPNVFGILHAFDVQKTTRVLHYTQTQSFTKTFTKSFKFAKWDKWGWKKVHWFKKAGWDVQIHKYGYKVKVTATKTKTFTKQVYKTDSKTKNKFWQNYLGHAVVGAASSNILGAMMLKCRQLTPAEAWANTGDSFLPLVGGLFVNGILGMKDTEENYYIATLAAQGKISNDKAWEMHLAAYKRNR